MTFDSSLVGLMEDTVTIEPFSAESSARVRTYGTSVSYSALIQQGAKRVMGPDGKEVVSTVQVIIPERVAVNQRSRITLPTGFVPQTPPIVGVEPLKGLAMDHTIIYCGA